MLNCGYDRLVSIVTESGVKTVSCDARRRDFRTVSNGFFVCGSLLQKGPVELKTEPPAMRASRSQKKQMVIMFTGVVFISLAPLSLILSTVPKMTPEGWFQQVLLFVLSLSFSVVAGLALVGYLFFSSKRAAAVYLLVCVGAGVAVCFYPGIFQLAAGTTEVTGQFEKVERSKKKDQYWLSPQSKVVTKRRVRKYDEIHFRSLSGEPVGVKLIRADAERLLAAKEEAGSQQNFRVVYLKQLKRLISVEVANP